MDDTIIKDDKLLSLRDDIENDWLNGLRKILKDDTEN